MPGCEPSNARRTSPPRALTVLKRDAPRCPARVGICADRVRRRPGCERHGNCRCGKRGLEYGMHASLGRQLKRGQAVAGVAISQTLRALVLLQWLTISSQSEPFEYRGVFEGRHSSTPFGLHDHDVEVI